MSSKLFEPKLSNDNDLELVLRKHKKWKAFLEGKLKCPVCGKPINFMNIGFSLEDKKDIILVCNKRLCINRFFSDMLE
ncbi:MAG: hypothetical protein D6732_17075 [Methanobacteriota archaeon]|nr:MAG: hypothetical protein D6732_17075 [Euryarchaeota archaeon]